MNTNDDFALNLFIFLIVFCAGGLFILVGYVLYLLISILRDIKSATDTINQNIKNADHIKENIASSIDDIGYRFVRRQKLNIQLIAAKGIYSILKKLKK